MEILDKINLNLIFSIPVFIGDYPWSIWAANFNRFTVLFFLVVGTFGVVGAFRRDGSDSHLERRVFRRALLMLLILAGFGVPLYFKPLFPPLFLALLLVFILFSYITGYRVGLWLKKPGRILMSVVVGVVFCVWFFLMTGPVFHGPARDKEELRASYKSIFGSNPDEKAKQEYWKVETGSEKPSEGAKKTYWNDKK